MRRVSPPPRILLALENIPWLVSFIQGQIVYVVVPQIRLPQIWVLLWFRISIFVFVLQVVLCRTMKLN